MSAKKLIDSSEEPKPVQDHWPELMEHIDQTWRKKKGVGFFFRAKYFKELKELCRIYTTFGVMALWKLYLEDQDEDDFVRKAGHSMEMFFNKIPKLLDNRSWKSLMQSYEKEYCGEYPMEILDLGDDLLKNKPGTSDE